MKPDRITRRNMLIAAGVIFAAAMVWLIFIESGSYIRKVCGRINSFGYHLTPSDFFLQGYGTNTSIEELFDEELLTVVTLSRDCGFSADIKKVGTVEVMLCELDEDRVLIVYLVDKEAELAFIENRTTGSTEKIG